MRHLRQRAIGRRADRGRGTIAAMHIVVIGGGAAGFFGAIAAAEANSKAQVTLLERNAAVLGKVRISGGGRCNVTHACFDPAELIAHYPRGGQALLGPFHRFQPRDTMAWFEARGARLKVERDGRVFPVSDDSATIVDCLLAAARQAGVRVRTKVDTARVQRAAHGGFELALRDGEAIACDRLLLATGSSATGWRIAQALGHALVPPVPSLFTFKIDDPRLAGLAGISVAPARIALLDSADVDHKARDGHAQSGPVLITHWGLSGPAVLKLSAWAARPLHERGYRAEVEVNWLPELGADDLAARLRALKAERGGQLVTAHSPFPHIPQRLWLQLARAAGVFDEQRWAKLPRIGLDGLARELQRGRYRLSGKGEFKEEFVTCGGVDLDEVNFRTLESRISPGLYFAGEALDIDGVTGGFNFQSAWTTGWLAGRAMASQPLT
jgi:hypothetical protein